MYVCMYVCMYRCNRAGRPLINSTIAGQNVFFLGGGGVGVGQLGREKPRGGSGGEKPENFEIFIPKIAVNASNFKN